MEEAGGGQAHALRQRNGEEEGVLLRGVAAHTHVGDMMAETTNDTPRDQPHMTAMYGHILGPLVIPLRDVTTGIIPNMSMAPWLATPRVILATSVGTVAAATPLWACAEHRNQVCNVVPTGCPGSRQDGETGTGTIREKVVLTLL